MDSIASQGSLSGALSPSGADKAALNWVAKRIHVEEEKLSAYVVSPGLMLTDMSSGRFGEDGHDCDGGECGVRFGGLGWDHEGGE